MGFENTYEDTVNDDMLIIPCSYHLRCEKNKKTKWFLKVGWSYKIEEFGDRWTTSLLLLWAYFPSIVSFHDSLFVVKLKKNTNVGNRFHSSKPHISFMTLFLYLYIIYYLSNYQKKPRNHPFMVEIMKVFQCPTILIKYHTRWISN